jgi:Response regulator containing CheY-like receiver and SARP domains
VEGLASPEAACQESSLAQALTLYHGAFLKEDYAPWVLIPRERLRAKYLYYVERLGASLEQTGRGPEAAEWYREGLEADPLAERLYRHLMRCFFSIGTQSVTLRLLTCY